MRKTVLVALPLVFATLTGACSESTSPSGGNGSLPLEEGVYLLSIESAEIASGSGGPIAPACPALASAGLGSGATAPARAEFVDGLWRLRAASTTGGSFELRLAEGAIGPGGPGARGVTGSASGLVINTVSYVPPLMDVRATLGSSAELGGSVATDGRTAGGMVSGAVTFSNSGGSTVVCSAGTVVWSLSRLD